MDNKNVPDPHQSTKFSLRTLIGLPLLWASAFFVPWLKLVGIYFLPADGLLTNIVAPSLIAAGTGTLILFIASRLRRWMSRRFANYIAVVGLALLAIIAVKVSIVAVGPDWQSLVPLGGNFLLKLRLYKYGLCLTVLALAWTTRGSLGLWNRALSSLGLAFAALAIARIVSLELAPSASKTSNTSISVIKSGSVPTGNGEVQPSSPSRRVVWVIFDEADFQRMYGAQGAEQNGLPNFAHLANVGVFASAANSPASATLYSIPALLSGVPISGAGIRIDQSASLFLEQTNGKFLPFNETTTIFGALNRTGHRSSVLGFYQPYCKLFELERCDSFPWPEPGKWDSAFWTNVPDFVSGGARDSAYFGGISQNLIQLLPEYLVRDDSLTFIHLNMPHLPAEYADKILRVTPSNDPLIEYTRNLVVADRVLGNILHSVESQSSKHDLLLVVSTDHWLRKRLYYASGPEVSLPVPFIAWKVGDTSGVTLPRAVSTVHTAQMIVEYLEGRLSTQADLAKWLEDQPVYPTYIAPDK